MGSLASSPGSMVIKPPCVCVCVNNKLWPMSSVVISVVVTMFSAVSKDFELLFTLFTVFG